MAKQASITIDEETALWFRARRGFLAGPGAPDPATAVRAVVGIQAQKEAPALLGISQRMASRPTAVELIASLRSEPRTLVRTWGQRDTLHIFDPNNDWACVKAARSQWQEGSRRGKMPNQETVELIWNAIADRTEPFTKEVIFEIIPKTYLADVQEHADNIGMDVIRFAATRILWVLARRGDLSLSGKSGAERLYSIRQHWYPGISWPDDQDSLQAAAQLARRYLKTYAPATPADIAHFFGARVTEVRTWLSSLETELVSCGNRKGLLALSEDAADLQEAPPKGSAWPLRLLPLWDGLLMGHKDKSWVVPVLKETKQIWRPGAYVLATLLSRGRIVGTWKHKPRRGLLEVTVTPLSGWKTSLEKSLNKEAKAVAHHLGFSEAKVQAP